LLSKKWFITIYEFYHRVLAGDPCHPKLKTALSSLKVKGWAAQRLLQQLQREHDQKKILLFGDGNRKDLAAFTVHEDGNSRSGWHGKFSLPTQGRSCAA
jgi:hypothetical protein